jgi:gliding motility-associated lipoprotein GldH
MNKRLVKVKLLSLAIWFIGFSSCNRIDLFEKVIAVPKHEWSTGFKPVFSFTISDTASPYQLFVILRHTNRYNYNNIWLNVYTRGPADTFASKALYELKLATNDKGWLGTGMDDLYEHRIALTPLNDAFYFKKAGKYTFALEHIMREDPLQSIMNVGLRIEKKAP